MSALRNLTLLTTQSRDVFVGQSPRLEMVLLSNATSVDYLRISELPSLKSFEAPKRETSGRGVYFTGSQAATSLRLPELVSGRALLVAGNPSLSNIELPRLSDVWYVVWQYNDAITDLSGLSGLTSSPKAEKEVVVHL